MISESQVCMWEGCSRQTEVVLGSGKASLALCREHFKMLVRRLSRAAQNRGSVSLSSLRVRRLPDGKVKLALRRKSPKRS